MSNSETPNLEVNPEQDDLHTVATKLGVMDFAERDKITPTKKQLEIINGKLDVNGNSYLINFTKLGKSDVVEFLLKFDGIDVNHENNDYEAAVDVAKNEKQDLCLLKLLEADALFPPSLVAENVDNDELKKFLWMREKLHADIEAGDLMSVENALRDQKPSIYLSKTNKSALFWAEKCEQIEIFAYLLGKGAKFLDQDEEDDCEIDDYRLEKFNDLLQDQLLKIENYHVQKLLYRSKSPQALTRRRYDLLKGIYDYLNQFELISLIMKVLEYDDCDVVFDFENEHTNNMYRMEDIHAYGLTVRSMKRIFIGAKKCLSTEDVCKEVAGTLAHELCHMAMHVLYRNGARPYAATEESGSIGHEYKSVVKEISNSVKEKKTDIDVIIQEVFNYDIDQWECELIVRVPHMLAAYGKEVGEQRLNLQAKGLYDFYLNHIVRDSSGYTNPAYFKKALCSIESLHTYHGCISEDDKQRNPFKVPLKSFRSNLLQRGIMQVLTTNIVKLGALHIYHEMKMTERYQIDKSCLFFRLDCFLKNFNDILKAFDCNVCRLMVLVCNEERVDIDDTETYFYGMDIASRNKEIILVANTQCEMLSKGKALPRKSFDYLWTDFSEPYKEECLKRRINFKGNDSRLNKWIDMGNLSKLVQSEDISRLIAEEPLVIWDGRKNDYQVYKSYYYIERDLAKVTVDATFFKELPKSTGIYITGMSKEESAEFCLDENRLQWLIDDKKKINNSKNIFIREKKGEAPLKDEFNSIKRDSKHWLQFSENKFHVVTLRGSHDGITNHLRRTVCPEMELIKATNNRIILISDDPGTGKSTLFSSLIRKINMYYPNHWVARINLIEHAHDNKVDENFISLEKIETESRGKKTQKKNSKKTTDKSKKVSFQQGEVLDIFFQMAGFRSSLDIFLMKQISKSKNLGNKCMVFIDGYDEVSSSYRENLMKLFKALIMETSMQVWITTRVHERIDLEVELSTCSFSLLQFSDEKQITFLDKLWKHKLLTSVEIKNEADFLKLMEKIREKMIDIVDSNKENQDPLFGSLREIIVELEDSAQFPSWDIKLQKITQLVEALDFSRFACFLLSRSSLKDEEIKFTGIPLHLFMVGNVTFDKNFRVDMHLDLFRLYTKFVEGKIDIYWKEKLKITKSVDGIKKLYEKEKEGILDLHMNVAKIVINGGKSTEIDMKDVKDTAAGVSVGILSRTGDTFQFIHRTFAEYFFAEWILQNMEESILMEVMFNERYNLVRMFLSSAVEREDREVELEESSFKKLRMDSFFITFAKKPMIRDSNAVKLFRKILHAFEEVCAADTMNDFILKVAKFINQKTYPDNIRTFQFLRECLTDRMLADLFGTHIDKTFILISKIIRVSSEDNLKEILGDLEEVFWSRSKEIIESDELSEDEDGGSRKPSGENLDTQLIIKFVRFRDSSGHGIMHLAASNPNTNVFSLVLEFLERLVNEDEVRRCILETAEDGSNIIHCSATRGALNIQEIITSIEGKVPVLDLLISVNASGRNVLHVAAENLQTSSFGWLLDFLYRINEGVTLKELFEQGDENGETIIHLLCKTGLITRVDQMLQKLKDYFKDEILKGFMKRRDNNGNNIFHFIGSMACLDDVPIFKKYFDKNELTELLLQKGFFGQTCLHLSLEFHHLDTLSLISNIRALSDVLDPDSFIELLLTKDNHGATFVKNVRDGYTLFVNYEELVESIREYLPEPSYHELINE